MAEKIKMVDLQGQYMRIRDEVDAGIREVIGSAAFINGPAVGQFRENLGRYLGGIHVIPCANGTDALFIALLSLGLKPGDEVIVPAFTYVSSAEVIGLLRTTRLSRRILCATGTTQHGADSGQQLARLKRLDHIVVGAKFQSHDTIGRIAESRQKDHGHGSKAVHGAKTPAQ